MHKGASAGAACILFFEKCGVNISAHMGDSFYNYKSLYELPDSALKAAYVAPCKFKESHHKFIYLLTKKCPVFWVERDPISRLKTLVNHIENYTAESYILPIQKEFNLTTPYSFPQPFYFYCNMLHYPNAKFLERVLVAPQNWGLQERLEILKNQATAFLCLEFSEFSLENAFETTKKLSKKLGIPAPKEKDKEVFSVRSNSANGELLVLPAFLYVNKEDLDNVYNFIEPLENTPNTRSIGSGIKITISKISMHNRLKSESDITNEIIGDILEGERKFNDLLILISANDYKKLKADNELFGATKRYLRGYIKALIRHAKSINERLVTEKDLLEFLRQNPPLCEKFKAQFDEELAYVVENCGEYIKKWKYYNEFLKMI